MPPLKTHWIQRAGLPRFRQLGHSLDVDVVVVGAGITGITAAYLLKKAGKTVTLLERDRCARVDTAHTTAHLTYVTDTRLSELVRTFGKEHAQAAWDAGRAAMLQIRSVIEDESIDCDFTTIPAYLHAPWKEGAKDEAEHLQEDASVAADMGFDAEYLDSVPFADRPGVRFANQAKFHPLRYLAALLSRIPGDGSFVYEHSDVTEFQPEPLGVKANGYDIRCNYIIIATHVPLMGNAGLTGATLFQSKLAAYSSYALGAKLPKGLLDEALFWDTADPYYYLRLDSHSRYDYVILGGEDHRTGQKDDTKGCFERLEDVLRSILPSANVDARWSGQVIETPDGLPYCGETAERQFAATGFAGNGMTFGTLAAMMGRCRLRPSESVARFVRSRPKSKDRLNRQRLSEGKRQLSLLPAEGQAGRRRGKVPRRGRKGDRENPETQRAAGRGLPGRQRPDDGPVAVLHPHGLHRSLEQSGLDLGLPLSRLAL